MTTAQAKSNTDQATIAQLKVMGFSDDLIKTPRRLVASLSGREKTGKTHFSLTAPEPIVFINIDIGTEGVVNKFQGRGKQILIYDVRVPKEGVSKEVYQTLWQNLKMRIQKAYTLKQGTVIWDTSSEAYELARLAHFGKLTQVMPHNYVEVNNEWRELLRIAYDSPLNTVFIHKMKAVWINNARTNNYEPTGFGEMDYMSQINLICSREGDGSETEFSVFVKDCRQNPNIGGEMLRGPMCNFEFLLSLVHSK